MTRLDDLMFAASLASLAALCVLVLWRVARAEGVLHQLRVVVFTALLWVATFYLFSLACEPLLGTGCDAIDFQSPVYPCTEM